MNFDDDSPRSELVRIMPPRQRSELRQALDAGHDSLRQALDANRADHTGIVASPDTAAHRPVRRASMTVMVRAKAMFTRPAARWLGGFASTVVAAVLAALIVIWTQHH